MIGEALRRMRGAMHQDELAAELGISRAHLSRIENGRQDPRAHELARWVEVTCSSWAEVAEAFGRPVQPHELAGAEELEDELRSTIRQKARTRAKLTALASEFAEQFWAVLDDDSRMTKASREAVMDAFKSVEESWAAATDQTAEHIEGFSRACSGE